MRELPLAQVKARLSALVDEVEGGGEVVITRRGRPVARLVPERRSKAGARRRSWVEALRRFVATQAVAGDSGVIAMRAEERY